jgi:predicted HTH transcriptional regulator
MVCGTRHKTYAYVAYGVSATTSGMALTEDDLSPAQKQSLELLREGRVTAPFVAEQADYSLQYIREELTDLVKHGHVSKIHDGLYELVDDPREDDA